MTTDGAQRTRGRIFDLERVAEEQYGCFTDDQALAAGFTRRAIDRRISSGAWRRIGPSTVRWCTTPVTWRMRLSAARLDAGPQSLVAGHAAAALYGVEGFPEGPVEVTGPRCIRNRQIDGTLHSSKVLPQIDRFVVDGFPVTSGSRTTIDLAPRVNERQLERLVDHVVRTGLSSPEFLRKRLEVLRGPGRAGVVLLARVLTDAGGHSYLEREFLKLVREAGLPRPLCQVVHRRDGTHVARVDFLFDPPGLVVEVMGRRGHVSEAERARDAQRQAELVGLGRVVVPFTSRQVFGEPDATIALLRRALAAA